MVRGLFIAVVFVFAYARVECVSLCVFISVRT